MKDLKILIGVISKAYYPKEPTKKIENEIKSYFISRFETYKIEHNDKKSKDYALVDTIDYFSKQNIIKWELN